MLWSFENGQYAISNRHWVIRFTEIPEEVLKTLFMIFGQLPEDGTCLKFYFDKVLSDPKVPDFQTIYKGAERGTPGIKTPIIKESGDLLLRVFKNAETLYFVSERNLKTINHNDYEGEILTSGPQSPILYKDLDYIVLPVRVLQVVEEAALINQVIYG
jgi:hypothetical protein